MVEPNNSPEGQLVSNVAFYNQYYRMPKWVRHEVMHMAHDWHTGDLIAWYRHRRKIMPGETPAASWRFVLHTFKRDDKSEHLSAFPGLKEFLAC